jgi:amidohydrolase
MVELRRRIHRNPELGWTEIATTRDVTEALRGLGLEPHVRADGCGLHVDVGEGDLVVGFRADLDALPIDERTPVPHRSNVKGVMHACGHDAHTAIGVGIAAVLTKLDLSGRVRIIFQPAEERIPGGAAVLRNEGVHAGLSSIAAFHVDPTLEPWRVGTRAGPITGAADRIVIRLSGPGGHTSRPHQTVNLVYAAARVVTELPEVLRQQLDPRTTVAVVFGRVGGGRAENVIPDRVEVGGTIRLFDPTLWRRLPKLVETIVADLVGPLGAGFEIEYEPGAPPVVNSSDVVQVFADAARAVAGDDAVTTTHQSLGSEDFSWYLEDVPGALIRLGCALPNREVDLHSAAFDLDEACIEAGIAFGAEAMARLLERHIASA